MRPLVSYRIYNSMRDLPYILQVVDAGMRVMRVNFSHATFEEAELRLKNLRAVC